MEQELVTYIKTMERKLFGLTREDLQRLAYELAERNSLRHPFTNGMAGEDWVRSFMSRQKLSLRKAETTSIARATGFNRAQVQRGFDLLRSVMIRHGFNAEDMYNVDETGMQTSTNRPPRIVS